MEDLDYQKVQDIYLKWHDRHRPLSGFVKELLEWRDKEVVKARKQLLDEVYSKRLLITSEDGKSSGFWIFANDVKAIRIALADTESNKEGVRDEHS